MEEYTYEEKLSEKIGEALCSNTDNREIWCDIIPDVAN